VARLGGLLIPEHECAERLVAPGGPARGAVCAASLRSFQPPRRTARRSLPAPAAGMTGGCRPLLRAETRPLLEKEALLQQLSARLEPWLPLKCALGRTVTIPTPAR